MPYRGSHDHIREEECVPATLHLNIWTCVAGTHSSSLAWDKPMRIDANDFWSRVNIRSHDECWMWTGGVSSNGYGNYHQKSSHVIAFAIHHGIMPTNVVVRHTCNNKLCCNPHHLIDGTQKDNMRDMVISGNAGRSSFPGSSNPRTHLNESDVKRIRELGLLMRASDIARMPEYVDRISASGIRAILRGQNWKGK